MPASAKSPETLRVIESLLIWEGAAGNERVRELLDLHFTTVSRLLAQYVDLNPIGLSYSTVQRRWVADADFKPLLTTGTIEEYLAYTLTERNQDGAIVVRTQLDFGVVRHLAFAILHRAIREGLGVTAMHCSMRSPTPTSKIFYPHSLVEAGRRWHVRAYVPESGTFKDLALTRLSELCMTDLALPDEARQERDTAWTTQVALRVTSHPDLTLEQKQMVRAEYFGSSAARVETVRAALLPYIIHDLRAATDPARQQPPDFQLCVADAEKLSEWLMPGS
ncbi:hypothetical protein LDO31_05435 [Luteimonas sp. XNQY3]|nr:hypothetical protein [Luteimonas sp. XNQY3]MCD9005686.1 hypothetical protein [Luteimonas sp. XNQY3]